MITLKESACQCRGCKDVGLIPGSGRSPGEGNGNPLQNSCLGNPVDKGVWQVIVHGVTKELDTTERLPFHFSLSCIGEGNGNPLQCSCLENPRDWGAWWAAIYRVAQSRTRLKRLSSSSSNIALCICTTAFLSIHLLMDI